MVFGLSSLNGTHIEAADKMQASLIKSPLSSTTFSYRVAPAPAPGLTALREVTCMAKKKGIRLIVTLECTEARKENSVPSRYCTQKNRKNSPDRLELMKYNPNLRRHTLHKEIK